MIATLALLLGALFAIRLYLKHKAFAVDPKLPGPERLPFIGILYTLHSNFENWPVRVHELCEKYKATWGGPILNLGPLTGAFFITFHEKNVDYILNRNFDNYEKGAGFRESFQELLGNGIFASDGATWYRHRKIASRMFSRSLLKEASMVTLNKVKKLSDAMSKAEESVDIQDMFFRLTFDSTAETAFGVEYDSLSGQTQHPFALAFDEMQELVLERVKDPLYKAKKSLGLSQREQRISELKVILDKHAYDVISSRRRSAEDGSKLGPDILSRFLDYAATHKDPISDQELRDVVMNILVAGRDTTACALSWAILELVRHPEVQAKIIMEVNDVCGNVNAAEDGDYSYEAISKLTYTDAVIMEVLRLHPSVPCDAKFAVEDDTLPDGTFIPKGAAVGYTPYSMGRNREVWGEDAKNFKPERFLAEGFKMPSNFAWPVFNAGKRFCLGKPMAMNTMKLTLAYLLPRHRFTDTCGHDESYKWSIVMKMKDGFPVDVWDRSEVCLDDLAVVCKDDDETARTLEESMSSSFTYSKSEGDLLQ